MIPVKKIGNTATPIRIKIANCKISAAAFTRKLSPTDSNIDLNVTFVLLPINIEPNTNAINIPAYSDISLLKGITFKNCFPNNKPKNPATSADGMYNFCIIFIFVRMIFAISINADIMHIS